MTFVRVQLFAAAAAMALASTVSAEGWGTIKGQFVMADGKVPKLGNLNVNKDQAHCLSKGAIPNEKYVVDPKTKGVRWVAVWIAPEKEGIADHKSSPAIHPALQKIPEGKKQLVIDQPCCKFEPHLAIMRLGQEFVGKNSAPVSHNMKIDGQNGVGQNLALVPGGQLTIPAANWKTYHYPSAISCGIHPWMQAKLFVLGHPYFAVSDEEGKFEIKNVPAGKLRILMWHEIGWVHKVETGKKGFNGQAIEVASDKTVDLGKISVRLED